MAILLTGGTGKTSLRVARLLQGANIPFLLASRRGAAAAPEEIADPGPPMIEFINVATRKYDIKRFVLFAGNSVEKGGYHVGTVWQYLVAIGVEYCVIRATWFMERMFEQEHLPMSKNEGKMYTACADGKAPFISVLDIAAVAFQVLTDRTQQHSDYRVVGPELLTYDEIAAKLSNGLGRKIEHVRLSPEDNLHRYVQSGFPEHYAKLLTMLETNTAERAEERMNDNVELVTGRPPMKFDHWVQLHRSAWD